MRQAGLIIAAGRVRSKKKKNEKKKSPKSCRTQNTPVLKCIFLVVETPYGYSRLQHAKKRYVRHAECATHRAATHLPAGMEGVRTHDLTSLLRMSARVLCLASNGDWRSRSLKILLRLHSWGRRSDWLLGL